MIDEGNVDEGLENTGRDLAPTKSRLPLREPMSLFVAREILASVIGTPESYWTETSNLDRVGRYDRSEIWEALDVVSKDILWRHPAEKQGAGRVVTKKQTSYGILSLTVYSFLYKKMDSTGKAVLLDPLEEPLCEDDFPKLEKRREIKVGGPVTLSLSLKSGDNILLQCEVPLAQSSSVVREGSVRFSDFRVGASVVTMYDLQQSFSISKYRCLWRGMRWLSANLLSWDEDFRLPENLSGQALLAEESAAK